ncbi:efflux transporter outer membrane subunit [Brevundimonas sp.]|uniref:efflux transporter outer membrane subunit n=1 Tax=Brevundimonas sp. TaxID=1871086 RepID=UPI00391CB1F6
MRSSITLAAIAALLSGCAAIHTPYESPAAPVQPAWTYGETNPGAETSVEWWREFGEPGLNAIVRDVLVLNNDLAAASLRVRQARLQAGLARSDQWPQPGAQISASASRDLDGGSVTESYSTGVSLSYEVDLWGRLAALANAADWQAVASEEDYLATRLALIGTTTELYLQLAYLNERLDYARDSLDYALQVQDLVGARYAAGAESQLAVQEARQTVLSQQAALSQASQQRVETLTALGVLLGAGDGAEMWNEPGDLHVFALPDVRAGIPAHVLARRPDLRAAETRLRASLAETDAVRAGFYPSINLTGSLGGASTTLSQLLSNPAGTVAASLSLPFLDVMEMRLTNARMQAAYEEAGAQFRQTLATALAEVENALSARAQLAVQGERLDGALDAARRAEQINEVRYRAGETALRDLLDSQERRRSSEIALMDNRLERLRNAVTLYQALGA